MEVSIAKVCYGNMKRLQGKIALITGASRGIGAAVAKRYAEEGAELILVSRTVGGLEATDDAVQKAGSKAMLVPLDLRQHELIDALGAEIAKKYGKLDILVGNAASLGVLTPLNHADPKMWAEVMDTNLTANWRLIRALDPLLQRSEAGRAIFVSSGAAKAAFAYWGAYAASKAALEMLLRTYAAENAKTNVKANLIDPGIVATQMRKNAFPGENAATLPKPEDITDVFVDLAERMLTANGQVFSIGD